LCTEYFELFKLMHKTVAVAMCLIKPMYHSAALNAHSDFTLEINQYEGPVSFDTFCWE